MSIVGLDHVQVAAPRAPETEARARAFYGDLLGLREIEKPEALKAKGGVWFSTGTGELHVGLEDSFEPARKAHPAFLVSGLPMLRASLETAGVPTFDAEAIPGADRFYVHDPFGNRIELIEKQHENKNDKLEGAKLGWKLLDTTYPFANRWIKLRQDRIEIEGKGEITFTYHEHRGAVCVVPVLESGEVALLRQYRYTVDKWCLEVPAGGLHDTGDSSFEEVARKELQEEVGATCKELIYINSFYSANGQSDEAIHVYLALGVDFVGETRHELTEIIELCLMPVGEALRLARAGQIDDGISALSILLCETPLRARGYI